ncbi:DnaB-like helicase N-terminal domain-containing protein [Streptosporangium sp. CA-115845]|uniref:DnaB-like helicase N-terminal domain-containing protein n=1 Tax=Streptosporangium sp. CA-115845 TaxID=3240071 RepID=UPI003D907845
MRPDTLAERALLGSFLRDPRQISPILTNSGLQPQDFSDPDHQSLLKVMAEQAKAHDLRSIDGWNAFRAILELHAASLGRSGSWLQEIAATVPNPSQTVQYAGMVLEGSTRRTIAQHAQRIAASMTAPGATANAATEQITLTRTVLLQLANRWNLNPDTRPEPAAAPAAGESAPAAGRSAPAPESQQGRGSLLQRGLAALRAPFQSLREVSNNATEDQLLASLVVDPGQLFEIRPWLETSDFTTPQSTALYQALLDLEKRGQPINAITVVFEASRTTAIDDRQVSAFLARCADAAPGQAVPLARDVVERGIATAVDQQTQRVLTSVTSVNATPRQAIPEAFAALESLNGKVERWHASRSVTASDTMTYAPPPGAYGAPLADPAATGLEPGAKTSM